MEEAIPKFDFDRDAAKLAQMHRTAKRPDGTYGFSGQTYWVYHRPLDPRRRGFRVLARLDYGRVNPTEIRTELL